MKNKTLILLILLFLSGNVFSQNKLNHKKQPTMKLNSGIITSKIDESKAFYTKILNFGITFQNEFYLLLHTPDKSSEISFLLPNHPSQQSFFHKPFPGQGMYLTIEVDKVDEIYERIKKQNIPIKIEIRNEPWGDRHFAIEDPNGVGIDIVTYAPERDN